MPTYSGQRRFQFRLRALMLVVLVTGLWLGSQINQAHRQRDAVATVEKHGGWVHYDYEFVNGIQTPGRQPWGPHWLRRWIGDEFFQEVTFVSFVYDRSAGKRSDNHDVKPCDEALALLSTQFGLRSVLMKKTQATDAGFAQLEHATNLEDLYVWDSTLITDDGVRKLEKLINLKNLHIDNSRMTDEGFRSLSRMTKMKNLVLQSHRFSDRGFSAVRQMKQLESLCVGGKAWDRSLITDEGLAVVADMKELENLNLSYTSITSNGLRHVSKLGKLKILDLAGCDIRDDGLTNLAGLTNLQWLILSGSNVTDRGLARLTGLKKLKLLKLDRTRVDKDAKRTLENLTPGLRVY